MDLVRDKGVQGPGPRRGSIDQGSMFCTFSSMWGCIIVVSKPLSQRKNSSGLVFILLTG